MYHIMNVKIKNNVRYYLTLLKMVVICILFSAIFSENTYGADLSKISSSHPRIFINANNKVSMQSKITGALGADYNDMKLKMNEWKSGWSFVDGNASVQTVLSMACGLIYQIEADPTWAVAPIKAATTPHTFSFASDDGGHYLEMYAIVYDWLYDEISPSDKAIIINNITSIADSFLANYTTEIKLDDYHNYMTQWINGIMTAGLAIYSENPTKGAQYINFATQALYEGHNFINANNEPITWNFAESVKYSNGFADFEGIGYYKNAIPEIARAIEAWDSATLRYYNMWNTYFPQFINTGDYIMYGHTPNNNQVKFEDIDPNSTTISARYIGILSLLENQFNSGYFKSYIDEKFASVNDWQYGASYKVFYLLFFNPAVTAIDYKTLATDLHADNYYFMKSGWNIHDTYIAFKAGTHYGYHSHSNHNSFYIWNNENILSASGGMYKEGCITFDNSSKNLTAWNRQSVASNTITIFDPTDKYTWKNYLGTTVPNAGGQRMPYIRHASPNDFNEDWSNMPWSGGMIANNSITKEIFKFANVEAWEHDDTYYAYVKSDATKAYSNNYSGVGNNPNDKVNLVEREFVYLKPNYIVIYDRVNVKSKDFVTSHVLHSIGTPTVFDTTWHTPSTGITDFNSGYKAKMDTGNSRLFIQTLLPASNVKYHVIGGAGYENYIESTATNYGPNCTVEDYNMRWRIEIQPTSSQLNHVFLNLLEVSNTGKDDIIPSTLLTLTNMQGVHIKDNIENKVVLFSSDKDGAPVSSLTYSVTPTSDMTRHFVFDLLPNTNFDRTVTNELKIQFISITLNPMGSYKSSSNGVLIFTTNVSETSSGLVIPPHGPPTPIGFKIRRSVYGIIK